MKKVFAITVLALYLLPVGVFAVGLAPYWGPLVSCTGQTGGYTTPAGKFLPQCQSFCDLLATAQNFINFGMTIALYVIAPIFFAWGGIMILTAGGSPEKVKAARGMLLNVAIGVAIVLASFVIVSTFFYLFNVAFKNPAGGSQSGWADIKCVSSAPTPLQCGGTVSGSCPSGQSCMGTPGSFFCGNPTP